MLLAEDNEKVNIMELGLAVQESLRYLNAYGIPGDYMGDSVAHINGRSLLVIYELFEGLLEKNMDGLQAVYVRIVGEGLVKVTLEGVTAEISPEEKALMASENINYEVIYEDEVTYIRIFAGKESNV